MHTMEYNAITFTYIYYYTPTYSFNYYWYLQILAKLPIHGRKYKRIHITSNVYCMTIKKHTQTGKTWLPVFSIYTIHLSCRAVIINWMAHDYSCGHACLHVLHIIMSRLLQLSDTPCTWFMTLTCPPLRIPSSTTSSCIIYIIL